MSSATSTPESSIQQSSTTNSWLAGAKLTHTLVTMAVSTLVGMLAVGLGVGDGGQRLAFSWLLNLWFVLTICLGAIFFVAIQHITRSGWSVSLRRIAEILGASIVGPVLLLVPPTLCLLLGYTGLFPWNDSSLVAEDAMLQGKQPFLNAPFFAIRTCVYAVVWVVAGVWLFRISLRQDVTGETRLTGLLEGRSAGVLIAMGLTVTFAAFDWLMSLDPWWFSTIYGIYVFAGAMVSALSVLAIVVAIWVKSGLHSRWVTREHLHDTAKLMFGFNCFWAYIAFSQYLLIWYANIPEETVWLIHRQQHGWNVITQLLIFGHFVIPFLVLMPRNAKRDPNTVMAMAVLLLVMHWLDLYWLVYPQLETSPVLGVIEFMGLLFFLSFTALAVRWFAGNRPLIPANDPRMSESVTHHVA